MSQDNHHIVNHTPNHKILPNPHQCNDIRKHGLFTSSPANKQTHPPPLTNEPSYSVFFQSYTNGIAGTAAHHTCNLTNVAPSKLDWPWGLHRLCDKWSDVHKKSLLPALPYGTRMIKGWILGAEGIYYLRTVAPAWMPFPAESKLVMHWMCFNPRLASTPNYIFRWQSLFPRVA